MRKPIAEMCAWAKKNDDVIAAVVAKRNKENGCGSDLTEPAIRQHDCVAESFGSLSHRSAGAARAGTFGARRGNVRNGPSPKLVQNSTMTAQGAAYQQEAKFQWTSTSSER
jgi:hypothetical protein